MRKDQMSLATSKRLIPLIGLIIGSSAIGAAEPVPAGGLHKYTPTAEELREAYQRSQKSGQARLYKAQITPNWFQNDTRFWYRNELRGGAKEFIVVEAERGIRKAAFDHHKLAAALSKRSEERRVGKECRSRWSRYQ